MAKIRVIIAASIDGFLPAADDPRWKWLRTDRRGFRHWRKTDVYDLHADCPLVDLICEKQEADNTNIYQAEIDSKEQTDLLHGLFLYHIVDEVVLYLFPLTQHEGIRVMDSFTSSRWRAMKANRYRNGICRLVYKKE